MTDKLLELAEKAGVETVIDKPFQKTMRPRLDIAHELLAKIDGDVGIYWAGADKWRSYWDEWDLRLLDEEDETTGTFEECVVALAERWLKQGVSDE